jgi:hypothetical protein
MRRVSGPGGYAETAVAGHGWRRRDRAEVVILLGLAVVAVCTMWYRGTYNVMPGQSAGERVRWCGRDYEYAGPSLTRQQVTALVKAPLRAEGAYPLLAVSRGALFAPAYPAGQQPSTACSTLVFLRTGADVYKPYELEGGP